MDFLWGKLFKSVAKRGAQALVAGLTVFLAQHADVIAQYGVSIEINEVVLIGVLVGLAESVRNWLKHKKGISWL